MALKIDLKLDIKVGIWMFYEIEIPLKQDYIELLSLDVLQF